MQGIGFPVTGASPSRKVFQTEPSSVQTSGHSRRTWMSGGQGEIERGALADFGFDPDAASVSLDDPMHNREPDARAFELEGAVKPLEGDEKFVGIFHVKSGPVVADKIDIFLPMLKATHFDDGGFHLAGVLEGVGQKIDEDLL